MSLNPLNKLFQVLTIPIMILLILSGCASSRLSLGHAPEGEVVDADGQAPVDPKDLDGTKRRALLDAKKNAVEMVVGALVTASTKVDRATLIESKILSQSEGYIQRYDLIKEWQEPQLYHTRIRALVAFQKLNEDLKDSGFLNQPQIGNPRVAVLLTESVKGGDEAPTFAGDSVAKILLEKGYRIVDRADLLAAKATEVQHEIEQGNTSHMASLGKQLDAEILVFGTAEGDQIDDPALGGLVSIRTTISLKSYRSQTNEVLGYVSKTASGVEVARNPAIQKSFSKAGALAGEELANALFTALRKGIIVTLTVSGIRSIQELKQLQNAIASLKGVGNIYLRSYDKGNAVMEISIKEISTQQLAQDLPQASTQKLSIDNITSETITAAAH